MHRLLASRRSFSPMLAILVTGSSFAACAPWDLGADDTPDIGDPSSVVIAAEPPPAISGGTLAVSRSATRAVAADPRVRLHAMPFAAPRLPALLSSGLGDHIGPQWVLGDETYSG